MSGITLGDARASALRESECGQLWQVGQDDTGQSRVVGHVVDKLNGGNLSRLGLTLGHSESTPMSRLALPLRQSIGRH